MEILVPIKQRRSVRAYAARPVEQEKVEAVVRAGNLAPVFGSVHVSVVENGGLVREIGDIAHELMRHCGNEFLEKRAATEGYDPVYGAPVMAVLSAAGGNDENGFNMANVSCAAENMITQATELGLGTCFVMGPMIAFADAGLAAKVGIPEGSTPLVGVLMGYPAEPLADNPRQGDENVNYVR